MKLFNLSLPVIFCTILTACSSTDEIITPDEETTVELITTLAQSQVKPDIFKTQILGFGWRNVAEYKYDTKTNKFSENEYFGREENSELGPLVGASPVHYFFGEDAIILYSNTIDPTKPESNGSWASKAAYTFDSKNNYLAIPNSSVRYLFEELKDDTLIMITSNGTGDYRRIVLERMTDVQLEQMNAIYQPKW